MPESQVCSCSNHNLVAYLQSRLYSQNRVCTAPAARPGAGEVLTRPQCSSASGGILPGSPLHGFGSLRRHCAGIFHLMEYVWLPCDTAEGQETLLVSLATLSQRLPPAGLVQERQGEALDPAEAHGVPSPALNSKWPHTCLSMSASAPRCLLPSQGAASPLAQGPRLRSTLATSWLLHLSPQAEGLLRCRML